MKDERGPQMSQIDADELGWVFENLASLRLGARMMGCGV